MPYPLNYVDFTNTYLVHINACMFECTPTRVQIRGTLFPSEENCKTKHRINTLLYRGTKIFTFLMEQATFGTS